MVNTPGTFANKANNTVRVRGSDRFVHVPDFADSKFVEGSVVFSGALHCGSFARLRHISEGYQRVVWHRLTFKIVPQCSTQAAGGYVAAFLVDPSDNIGSGADALTRLVSQKGARVSKIWDSVTVSSTCVPGLLYTSAPTYGDSRLYSPGRFVLAADSQCSAPGGQKIPLTVYVDWDVTLSVPSLEGDAGVATGAIVAKHAGWLSKTEGGILGGNDISDPNFFFPGIQGEVVYRLKNKVFVSFAGDATTVHKEDFSGNFDRVMRHVWKSGDPPNVVTHNKLYFCDYSGNPIHNKCKDHNYWVLEEGDVLTPEPKNESSGSQFLCQMSKLKILDSTPIEVGTSSRQSQDGSKTQIKSSSELQKVWEMLSKQDCTV